MNVFSVADTLPVNPIKGKIFFSNILKKLSLLCPTEYD